MPLNMVHANERQVCRKAKRLGIGQPDQERAGEAGPGRNGDGAEIRKRATAYLKRFADNWDDGAKVLARSKFRHNTAVFRMGIKLGGDDARSNIAAVLDNRRRSLVTRALDAQNQSRIQFVA